MLTKFIKKLIKDYVDSRIGSVEYNVKNLGERFDEFNSEVFLKNGDEETPFSFYPFKWSIGPNQSLEQRIIGPNQSLEQRIKDIELKMEALEKHLKVSINFVSKAGFMVRKVNPRKR